MRVTIHRGTHQIGGCVTEIEHERYKVFIDFGTPLPGSGGGKLFPIEGLTTGDVSRSALFISHYHGDHIGNVCEVSNELPVFIGKTAYQIYESLEKRLSHIPDLEQAEVHRSIARHMQSFRTFTPLDTLEIGTISVTPLMVDHSAIDAYMFLIQAGGTRLLHTGDFRLHGFRGRAYPTLSGAMLKILTMSSQKGLISTDRKPQTSTSILCKNISKKNFVNTNIIS